MIRRPLKTALLCAVAVTLLVSCGDDRPPPTAEPTGTTGTSRIIETTEPTAAAEPTTTTEATPTTSTTVVAEAAEVPPAGDAEPTDPDGGGELEVDGDSTWQDVFDTLGPSEQACISEELGDDDLQLFLEQPVLWSGAVPGEWTVLPCLEPAEAGELLLAMMVAVIEAEGLTLGSEERACLRDHIGDIDWTTLGGPDSGDDPEALAGLSSGFATCVPDLLIAAMGIQPGELSDGERECLVEAIADILSATLIASDLADDPAAAAGLTAQMMGCVPDFFLEMMLAGFDIRLDELAEEERACLRDWLTGFDWAGASSDDATLFAGSTLGMMRCLPDIFLEFMVSDVGVDLEEFTGEERACLRDWLLGIDATALWESAFGDDPAGFAAGMVGCAPDVFFVALLTGAGLDPAGLSDEQRACLQDWMIGNDATSLAGLLFGGFPEVPGEAVATCGIDDHANGYDAATTLGVGEPIGGTIHYDLDVDYFVFEAEAGQYYEIDVALGTLEDSTVTLYDPDGAELAYNDDVDGSLASHIAWTAPDAGNYHLAVGGYGSGTYTLTVTASVLTDDHANSPAGATAVEVGEPVEGALEHGEDVDYFVFEAEAGRYYEIDVSLGTLEDSTVTLYDADGAELAYNDDHGESLASHIAWTAPDAGNYHLAVAGYASEPGTYTLTVTDTTTTDDPTA